MHPSTKFVMVLVLVASSAGLDAQGITNGLPAVVGFVDLETIGGIAVTPTPSDDSAHNIVTTIGNSLFPAGNVRIGNNGVVVSGATTGGIAPANVAIPAAGVPIGLPSGNGIVCAYWDDLVAFPFSVIPTKILWTESAGVLYIMWKNEWLHTGPTSYSGGMTFEIQVFSAPAPGTPRIQILYPDAQINAIGNGLSATVGYVAGTNPAGNNAQWSFDTAGSIPNGAVLSILEEDFVLIPSSPLGPGSIRFDVVLGQPNGTYFMAVTAAAGSFPNGWLFGLDISYAELASQFAAGFPFTGPLNANGNATLGPFQGLPPITLYAIAFAFPPGSLVPSGYSPAIAYTVP